MVLLLLLVILGQIVAGPLRADDDDDAFGTVPNQVVVKLAPGVKLAQINKTYRTTTIAEMVPGSPIYLLATRKGTNIDRLIHRMSRDRRIIYAEPNFFLEQPEIDRRSAWGWGGLDPAPYIDQYARELINLDGAHALGRGAGAIVAIVDTGVQLDHPALAGSLTSARLDSVEGDGVPSDAGNGLDDDGDGEIDEGTGHGTHVAGIVRLVAPDAQIMPLRALDSDGRGSTYAVASSIQFALAHNADVINLSLGVGKVESDVLTEATRAAAEAGALVVAAAGNQNSDVPQYPADDECVVAVSSVGPMAVRAPFANFGSWIDLVAPGVSIYSTFPTNGYAWWSGSSMAAPFVSGLAGLLYGNDPTLSPIDVSDLIGTSARSTDEANPDYQGNLGYGLIDAEAALLALAGGQQPASLELIADGCTANQ